jgi:hypothetical protein
MEQVTLFDLGQSVADASGGIRSRGRSALLLLLQAEGMTEEKVGKRVKCCAEFVSLVASGKRKPQRWRLRIAFEREYGILAHWWDELPVENVTV